jgi:hypothetical protein
LTTKRARPEQLVAAQLTVEFWPFQPPALTTGAAITNFSSVLKLFLDT